MDLHGENARQLRLLTGEDQFGRTVPPAGLTREGRKVGMFFWLWIGQPYASGVYDAGRILALPDGKEKLFFSASPESPDRQQHFWGEPVWGYYNSADPWVISRQLELLTLAGVDFIVFDTTNAVTYKNVYTLVLREIERLQARGWDAPKAAFYTHSYSMRTAMQLYEELYCPGLYEGTWYREGGKPVIIAYTDPKDDRDWARREMKDGEYNPAPYPPEVASFFRFYKPQWPLDPFFPDGFPWVEWTFPQPLHGDVMSVTVASHPNVPFSFTLTRGKENWGRGWDVARKVNDPDQASRGLFFQSQWDRAIKADPGTLFVGGWNEWIAYKQVWEGEYMLCDAVNREFSRDIEPMAGGHGDAFYLQLIANIRRYKNLPYGEPETARPIVYRAVGVDPSGRDAAGVCEDLRYRTPDLPNMLESVAVSTENGLLRLEVAFRAPVTEDDLRAFQVLLGRGEATVQRLSGLAWRVGQLPRREGLYLHPIDGEEGAVAVEQMLDGARLTILVPLSALGGGESDMRFKASLYALSPEDAMRYDTPGQAVPPGRLQYIYPMGSARGAEGR